MYGKDREKHLNNAKIAADMGHDEYILKWMRLELCRIHNINGSNREEENELIVTAICKDMAKEDLRIAHDD